MNDDKPVDRGTELRENYLRKPIDREAKIAFLKKWGKTIPPDLLTGGLGKRNPDINPTADPMPPLWQPAGPLRYLACRSKTGPASILPIDEHGSCRNQNHISKDWHRYTKYGPYAEARPELMAIRCPLSLSEDEQSRLFDTPSEAFAWTKKAQKPPKTQDYSLED